MQSANLVILTGASADGVQHNIKTPKPNYPHRDTAEYRHGVEMGEVEGRFTGKNEQTVPILNPLTAEGIYFN